MKFLVQLIFIGLAAFLLELFFPWWTIAIAAFTGGAVFNTRANFAAGFLAVTLLWSLKAFLLHHGAAAPLADRMAALLFVNTPLLIAITGVTGGLVAGFAAMTGGALHRKKRRNLYY